VERYLRWLASSPDGEKSLNEPVERALAVREYKVFLLRNGSTANTVNSVLAALDNYFLYKGWERAKVKRQELPKQSPRALEPDEQRRFIKAVLLSTSPRNKAIAVLMMNSGLRISEVAQLNLSDVVLTARKHSLTVRCGKNNKRRTVPINKDAAIVLQQYLIGRSETDPEEALFTSQKGKRISVQSIDHLIRQFGKDAQVEVSSHVLRHGFVSALIRSGVDVVIAAELAGHARLETTRRYSLPSQEVMLEAVERLNYAAAP
jgi:integrase/recombinase XerC